MIEAAQKPRIAFLASPAMRASGMPARQFVDRFGVQLADYRIVTTGGVYQDLFADRTDLEVEQYKPHDKGGLVKIARDIVEGRCISVLNFPDQNKQQGFISYSLHHMLINQAIYHNIDINENPQSSMVWVSGNAGADRPEEQTLALIAHSPTEKRQPKNDLVQLATTFAAEFSRFQRIICTGTTGKTLADAIPALRSKLFSYESGNLGGDVQIADEINEGRCQHVIFLVNPAWAQPHRDDVVVFINLSHYAPVNLMLTTQSAYRWAGALRQQLQG
jgi:methylglyoxal synthase